MDWLESLAGRIGTECGLLTLAFFLALVGVLVYYRNEQAILRKDNSELRVVIDENTRWFRQFIDHAAARDRRGRGEEP